MSFELQALGNIGTRLRDSGAKAQGMDPTLLAMMAIQTGLSLFGGGGDQERRSFRNAAPGGVNIDPEALLARGLAGHDALAKVLTGEAKKPVRLRSAYAQALPTFTGGGLPMPIGALGRDPALADPSLLELPGLDFPGNLYDEMPMRRGPGGYTPAPPGPDNQNPGDGNGSGGGPPDSSGMPDEIDERQSAQAAIDLLSSGRRR